MVVAVVWKRTNCICTGVPLNMSTKLFRAVRTSPIAVAPIDPEVSMMNSTFGRSSAIGVL